MEEKIRFKLKNLIIAVFIVIRDVFRASNII